MLQKRHRLRYILPALLLLAFIAGCSSGSSRDIPIDVANKATPVVPETSMPATVTVLLNATHQHVDYPLFVPTNIPPDLTPAPPIVSDNGPYKNIRFTYRTADGAISLAVFNGPAGCCLDADPRKGGKEALLPHGIAAHFLEYIEPQYGGPILWWIQEETYIALSGPQLTKDVLMQVASTITKSEQKP